jgi:transposase InsO family protein
MRLQALKARPRRRRLPPDLGERQVAAVAPNVLDRSFEAPAPNRKWIADFTYVWTAEGWLYVAAVVDLFSRRVVGWSMNAAMTAQLVTDALVMAIWRRGKPDALLHHSDRGSQYTSEQFQRLMADHGVVCSMSRSGNVWGNAAMESIFSLLKIKRTTRKMYRTRDDAKADVFDYIERFYNPKRRHSTIGYLSPMEFERQAGLTQAGVNRTGCSSRRTCASEGSQPRAARVVQSNLNLETLPARLGAGPFSGGRYRVMLKLIFLVCPTLRVLCEKASLASDLTGPRCPIVE